MATLVEVSNRGRKKEALRIEAAALAGKVSGGNPKTFTVQVAEPKRKGAKGETVDVTFPTGTQFVPASLVGAKKDANVREQLRLAIEDANLSGKVGIKSFTVKLDNGEIVKFWALAERKPKAEKAPAKKK